MTNRLASLGAALLFGASLAACGGSTPPKSTTTTKTQTTTETDSGEKKTVDVETKDVEQPDGTREVERTETVKQVVPPNTPPPAPKQ